MNFEFIQSDIVNISADAIVLPANRYLKEGSGTSRAIFEAAGRRQLTQACRASIKEFGGPCQIGDAIPTQAFKLKANYIIHAVVPKWIDGKSNEYDLLSTAYFSSMHVADIMGCRQIAFPLLASGNNKFDLKLAFEIAVKSIQAFEGEHLQKAFLVLYGHRASRYAEELGYQVTKIPENIRCADNGQDDQFKKMTDDSKVIMRTLVKAGLEMGISWMKNPQNQKKVINTGINIVSSVIKN